MKLLKIISWLFVLFILTAPATYAQQQFTHTVTAKNKYCNSTCSIMDVPELNDNPRAVILVTPVAENGRNLNPYLVGVYYIDKKWSITNTDQTAIAEGAKFDVEYYANPTSNQFIYVIPAQGGVAYIDHPGLNANPNARIRFLPTQSPRGAYFNRHDAKIEYDPTAFKWVIANINNQPMLTQTAYNIVITSGVANNNPTRDPPKVTVPAGTPPVIRPLEPIVIGNIPKPGNPVKVAVRPSQTPPVIKQTPKTPVRDWILRRELAPTIGPNSDILLFVHGMDSRAEEADDITKALFALKANPPGTQEPPPPGASPTPDPQTVADLLRILQKYEGCILERYETKDDMKARKLPELLSGLLNTNGLQDRDEIVCMAGNMCSLLFRRTNYLTLKAQANRGDAANFETKLKQVIPKDCFDCGTHQERHTRHVHCTMDCGGNNGLFKGPCFETCKGGGAFEKLFNDTVSAIHIAATMVHRAPPRSEVTGGQTIATNFRTVQFNSCPNPAEGCPEACDHPDDFSRGARTLVLPVEVVDGRQVPLYFIIPENMLDTPHPPGAQINVPPARNLGMNEGRLQSRLRNAASKADPRESLRLAAEQFAEGHPDWGNAFADLSVTGHRAFKAFSLDPPVESFCQSLSSGVLNGCRTALDRAYKVANFLRTGQRGDTPTEKTRKTNERIALGWIAVSGEDDSPHRPVNVPSSDYPQYDINVEVPRAPGSSETVRVRARYVIAQSQTANPGTTGKNLVVISVDLPTSGYSDNIDYTNFSPLTDIGLPMDTPVVFVPTGRTPVLDFIENFIVRFVETLDEQTPIKKNEFKAVMGGSLGGNMTFRLGRRSDVPWLPKFIVWSPASIWDSLSESPDPLKRLTARKAWEGADRARNSPDGGDRAAFFGSWDKPIFAVIVPMAQSDTWTSDYYPCKKSSVAAARLDRHETYDANFLAWHWRLGAEQLFYSHQKKDSVTNRPSFLLNTKPMLLACGLEDTVAFNDICPATRNTAPLMTQTPGKALFLEKTGHSLDNERRTFWAREIIKFLEL